MKNKLSHNELDEMARELFNYFLGLRVTYAYKDHTHNHIVSGFLVKVLGVPLFITAGHCLESLDKLLEDPNINNLSVEFVDQLGKEPKYRHAIPYTAHPDYRAHVGNETSLDMGIIPLPVSLQLQLERSNRDYIFEQGWTNSLKELKDDGYEDFILLGIPSDSIAPSVEGRLNFEYRAFKIEMLEEKPDGFISNTSADRYYAKIIGVDDLPNVNGMSGGPVFAVKKLNNEQWAFHLVGIQSGQGSQSKVISICPGSDYIQGIKDYLQRKAKGAA